MSTAAGFECNLPDSDRAQQATRWKDLAPSIITKEEIEDGFQIAFDASAHAQLEELVATEQRCCGWASWSLERRRDHTVLEARGPATEIEALEAALGL